MHRGRNRRHRGRQPERLQQGAEADRRRDERLLRARLLLEESGRHQAPPPGRSEDRRARARSRGSARNTCSSRRRSRRRRRRNSGQAEGRRAGSRLVPPSARPAISSPVAAFSAAFAIFGLPTVRHALDRARSRYASSIPTPMKLDAEPRARDRRAAEAGERIHRHLNPLQAVQPQALLGQPRRERRRMRPVAVAVLNRLVRDEPGVAAAAHAARRAAPARDVRLVLIGHAERQPVEAGRRRAA